MYRIPTEPGVNPHRARRRCRNGIADRQLAMAGVPFYLRTGKRLAKRSTEIVIQFKRAPYIVFPSARWKTTDWC